MFLVTERRLYINMNGMFQNDPDYGSVSSFFTETIPQQPAAPGFVRRLADENTECSPALFRDAALDQMLAILISRTKANPLLVGPAGCGKTRLVEDLAMKLHYNDPEIPPQLQGFEIYELSLNALVENTNLQGALEKNIESAVRFFSDPSIRAICFIDEIHLLFNDPNYSKIAQVLKPHLARNSFRLIGATTLQESFVFETDPAFKRRFSYVILDELSKEQTEQILAASLPSFVAHYGNFQYLETSLPYIVSVADEYQICGLHRPDNALTLLDRSLAYAQISRYKFGPQNTDLFLTLDMINQTAALLAGSGRQPISIDAEKLKADLQQLKGQEKVINQITEAVENHYSGMLPVTRPLTMLFAGSSGTGKTQAAKILARSLFGTKPIVINLSEFQTSMDFARLIGSAAGYVGYDSRQELPFDSLRSNPFQVILLDEIEKAPQSVQNFFLQMLDEGELKTSKGITISFSRAIIIAATNAGFDGLSPRPSGLIQAASPAVSHLQSRFKPEFLNRFDVLAEFREIPVTVYHQILQYLYSRAVQEINRKYFLNLNENLEEAELDALCRESYRTEFGARPASKSVQNLIYQKIRESRIQKQEPDFPV